MKGVLENTGFYNIGEDFGEKGVDKYLLFVYIK